MDQLSLFDSQNDSSLYSLSTPLADRQALQIAVATYQACHYNGMPECNVNLAHAVVYLSLAPRSNALYT